MIYNDYANTRSVYLHWPFCPYRCHFCPFVALASHENFMPRYHDALKKEIDLFAQKVHKKQQLDTIFIGGGTPSTYPSDLLLDMSDKLKGIFDISEETEATIEVNPGTVSEKQLIFWRQIGINRLSIGVQSLNNSVLHRLNRLQKAADVRRLIKQASSCFESISIDLILGLPGVSTDEWKGLLQEVVKWPIQHVSIYFLTVHKDTRLYFDIQREKVVVPTDDVQIDLYHWSIDFLAQHGLQQYETSNFSRAGFECKHNNVYWDRMPYKGFGLGACSFDGTTRFQNTKNLSKYLETLESGKETTEFFEKLEPEQVRLEKIMLGLRRTKGLSLEQLFEHASDFQKKMIVKNITWLKQKNYVEELEGRLMLTSRAFVVQNDIVARLSL